MAALDLNKITASAVGAYLQQNDGSTNGNGHHPRGKERRMSTRAAVALGASLTLAAQAAYRRARRLDLEQVGTAMENKLK